MQSSPTELSNKFPVQDSSSEQVNTDTQHGLQQDPVPKDTVSVQLQDQLAGAPLSSTNALPAADGFATHVTDASSGAEESGLSTPATPSSRYGGRIYDYESALTPISRRSSEGPVFEIVPSTRSTAGRSPIAELPNELLTHALSHLPAHDLYTVALVSRRFHSIVKSPHSWRAAFARFFPGPTKVDGVVQAAPATEDNAVITDRRAFTRLTTLPSWQREYILRSRLLRSVQRGKPIQQTAQSWRAHAEPSRTGVSLATSPTVLYDSSCYGLIRHLHGVFEYDTTKRFPRFIHGADDFGIATLSDPQNGLDKWGVALPPPFIQFTDTHPGDPMWGLGSGEIIGNDNVMDVSQLYGMVYGSGSPGGAVYFRATTEQRGRLLPPVRGVSAPELGIPRILPHHDGISAVCMVKSREIFTLSEGTVGILSGHHSGLVSAFSFGGNDLREARIKPGELTARWVLSPGVPIIAIAVDESYSLKRQAENRIWAVALNALGELFYLTKFPKRKSSDYLQLRSAAIDDPDFEPLAWKNGRTVQWNQVELSRRIARPDPYGEQTIDGSYSPRSSWSGACLSKEQLRAETRELEEFLGKRPKDFRRLCNGWDMRRKMLVDFGGDDGNLAGEAIVVFDCGLEEESIASIKRFTRLRMHDESLPETEGEQILPDDADRTPVLERQSLFGSAPLFALQSRPPLRDRRSSERSNSSAEGNNKPAFDEWRQSVLSFGTLRNVKVNAVAIDESRFALLTASEDPAITAGAGSTTSSPVGTPLSSLMAPVDLPGQRARFVAVGTQTGSIIIWDIRSPVPKDVDLVNTLYPVSIHYTDSPEISCLALTALQLVHGGNDGLVQIWDPLGSTGNQPLRTLNSRFSSRARRRLAQAQASAQGVGINLFAAGAILLDPDATSLRGIVSLGSQLKYWAFSSSATDAMKGNKRRLRRGERGSNAQSDRFAATVRNANLKGYIASERAEMEWQRKKHEQERQHRANRFGTDLLQNEDEALAYARLLSEEALLEDEVRRSSQASTPALGQGAWASQTPARDVPRSVKGTDEFDAEIAEAIARSLDESAGSASFDHDSPFLSSAGSPIPSSAYDIPIRYASGRKGRRSPKNTSPKDTGSPTPSGKGGQSSRKQEMDDLEFALQLSLAEEESRKENPADEDFPGLRSASASGSKGRGKGKGKAWDYL